MSICRAYHTYCESDAPCNSTGYCTSCLAVTRALGSHAYIGLRVEDNVAELVALKRRVVLAGAELYAQLLEQSLKHGDTDAISNALENWTDAVRGGE